MMHSKEMFTVLALVAPLAVGALFASPLTSTEVHADEILSDLCVSTSACEYGPLDGAPVLRANVCWDGHDVTLAGAGGCVTGAPYFLSFGTVVDPVENLVLPYAPLPDTCDLGYCVPDELDPGDIVDDAVACCDPDTKECSAPDEDGVCTVGDITWCETLEDNGDGTVTCHE